jgi:hypothetical protein
MLSVPIKQHSSSLSLSLSLARSLGHHNYNLLRDLAPKPERMIICLISTTVSCAKLTEFASIRRYVPPPGTPTACAELTNARG